MAEYLLLFTCEPVNAEYGRLMMTETGRIIFDLDIKSIPVNTAAIYIAFLRLCTALFPLLSDKFLVFLIFIIGIICPVPVTVLLSFAWWHDASEVNLRSIQLMHCQRRLFVGNIQFYLNSIEAVLRKLLVFGLYRLVKGRLVYAVLNVYGLFLGLFLFLFIIAARKTAYCQRGCGNYTDDLFHYLYPLSGLYK